MMYADLFDQLGGGRGGGSGGASSRAASGPPEAPPLVSFKAGRVDLEWDAAAGVYECRPDTKRGQVRLVWSAARQGLEWQWMDRREKRVVDTFPVVAAANPNSSADDADSTAAATSGGTFERIPLDHSKAHRDDRVYVWAQGGPGAYRMYWMQDADPSKDDEVVAEVNRYLSDPASAAPAAPTPAEPSGGAGASTGAATGGAASPSTLQVDALSSILQNLGMPPAESNAAGGGASSSSAVARSAPSQQQQLTLADLQGAMAQVQQQGRGAGTSAGPSLDALLTPAAVSSLLADPAASARLLALLPPEQQTPDQLEANLRSPQLQQTLRALTGALLPDSSTGATDGLASLLANFQLTAPPAATASGNPIQIFLEAIVQQVRQEQEAEQGGGSGEAGSNDDDNTPMDE